MPLPTSSHEVPFLKLLIPLVAGIVVQDNLGIIGAGVSPIVIVMVIPLVLVLANIFANRWALRWIYGFAVNIVVFVFGLVLVANTSFSADIEPQRSADVLVKIADRPHERVKSYRAEGEIVEIYTEAGVVPASEKIMLYFCPADTAVATLGYADLLAMRIKPQPFAPPQNPYQFNFQLYMHRKGIRFSSYIAEGGWVKVGNSANPVMKFAKQARDRMLGLFAQSGLEPDELAVVSAITVGYKDLLDDELRRTYSATGAAHILAVSGLHVGVIYGMLLLVLGLIPKLNRHVKMVVSLLIMWFFAFITGLSPSVLRATAMFTMVEVGRSLGYRASTYNTLAAVAFILLVAEPNNLYDLGFQLSFLAVLSIALFNTPIRALLPRGGRLQSWLWDLLSVSVAAQIGTIPITLLNFGQFANYFLLTNVMAIPLSSVVLYMAAALLVVSPIPVVSAVVAKLLGFSVWLLNESLRWVERLPGSLSSGVYISTMQAIALSVAFLAIIFFWERRHIRALHLFMLMLIAFIAMQYQRIDDNGVNEVVVFSLPRSSLLCLTHNKQTVFFVTDTVPTYTVSANTFYLGGYIDNVVSPRGYSTCYAGAINNPTCAHGIYARSRGGLAVIVAGGYRIALPYNDSIRRIRSCDPLDVDILVVNRHVNEAVLGLVRPKVAVFDASVWKERFPLLAMQMLQQDIQVHDMQSQGAYRFRCTPEQPHH